jgi:hypothetical protein
MMHLWALAAPAIYWEGYIPGFLNQADEARSVKATTDAAAQCAQTGQPVEVPGPEGPCRGRRRHMLSRTKSAAAQQPVNEGGQ